MTSRTVAAQGASAARTGRPASYYVGRVAIYLVLVVGAIVMAFPFFWMVVTSFQSQQESLQQRPVLLPQRVQPANWFTARDLGAQGGSAAWGGLQPGRSIEFEVRARRTGEPLGDLTGRIPENITSDTSASIFGDAPVQADPRVITISPPGQEGEEVVWKVSIRNGGSEAFVKVPLLMSLPDGYELVGTTLPADRVGRDDRGVALEWSNVAPGLFGYLLENYRDALRTAPFGRYFLNSLITAVGQVALGLIVVTMAAFAFARISFRGRDVAFALILSSLMIPGEVLLVPNYLILSRLEWLNTYQALIVPWIASVFGIFLLRQFFLSLPNELFEAARIDGAGYGTLLFKVGLPLATPGLVTYALFSFLGSWNALLWPLIVTSTREMRTLQVGLQSFIGEAGSQHGQLMAASIMVISPIIIGFFLAQKQFIAGVARSGLK
jgi:multiple sugar transport system permease protein